MGFVLGALFVALLVVAYWVGYERSPRVAHMAPTWTTPHGTVHELAPTLTFSDDGPEPSVGPETTIATDNNGLVRVPPFVVEACIAEAKGNNAVLDRSLMKVADMVALGLSETEIIRAVYDGDVEAA